MLNADVFDKDVSTQVDKAKAEVLNLLVDLPQRLLHSKRGW